MNRFPRLFYVTGNPDVADDLRCTLTSCSANLYMTIAINVWSILIRDQHMFQAVATAIAKHNCIFLGETDNPVSAPGSN